jgi:hypothetical protein
LEHAALLQRCSRLPPAAPTAALPAATAPVHACCCRDARAELLADNAATALDTTASCSARHCSRLQRGPRRLERSPHRGWASCHVPQTSAWTPVPCLSCPISVSCTPQLEADAASLTRSCMLQRTCAPDVELAACPRASAARSPHNAHALAYKKGCACQSSTYHHRCHPDKLQLPGGPRFSTAPRVPSLLTQPRLPA